MHIVLPKLNILRSRVVTVRLQWDWYSYENRYSEFPFPANTGRFTIFFFFLLFVIHILVYYHETSGIYLRGGTPPMLVLGYFMLFCYCIIDICLYVLYVCIFYNNTVVEFKLNKIDIIQRSQSMWGVDDDQGSPSYLELCKKKNKRNSLPVRYWIGHCVKFHTPIISRAIYQAYSDL